MKDKKVISILLVVLALLVVIRVIIYFLPNKTWKGQHWLSDFAFIEIGMSYDEIIKKLGEPDRDRAFGTYAPEYDLVDGRTVILCFSPAMKLTKAWIVMPEGRRVNFFEYKE